MSARLGPRSAPPTVKLCMRENKTAEDIIGLNLATVNRALWALDLLAPADYVRASELIYGGNCGGHFRHIIQHYEAFFTGTATAQIDYDLRDRSAPLENDMGAARTALQKISVQLQAEPRSDSPLTVWQNYDPADRPQGVPSGHLRELQFLASHAIHHFAVIGIAMRGFGYDLPTDFSLAPSTRFHLQSAIGAAQAC